MQQMIFIADLIARSTCFGHHYAHHQKLDSIMMIDIMVPETHLASNKICNKNHLLHLVGILFPHIYCFYFSLYIILEALHVFLIYDVSHYILEAPYF
jgi:hypothetical protein